MRDSLFLKDITFAKTDVLIMESGGECDECGASGYDRSLEYKDMEPLNYDVTFDGRHDEDRCTRTVCRKCLVKWRDMICQVMTVDEARNEPS